MKKTLSIAALALMTIASCKKDKRDEVNKENITGTYKLSAWVSKTGTQPQEDEYAQMSACEKDDLTKLNSDMTYNEVDAGTVCNPPGNNNGTWSLPSASQIVLNGYSFTVKSFDGRTLVLTSSTGAGDNLYTSTVTLAKQ